MTKHDKLRLLTAIHYYGYRGVSDFSPPGVLFLRRGGNVKVSKCGGIWLTKKGEKWMRDNS